jgi:hypothetical protein
MFVLVVVLLLLAGAGIRYKLENRAQKKRAYATRLLSFTRIPKPGMTRKGYGGLFAIKES